MTRDKEATEVLPGGGNILPPRALSFDEARQLPQDKILPGLKVKGKISPFGGSWIYDPESDELTLREAPTRS